MGLAEDASVGVPGCVDVCGRRCRWSWVLGFGWAKREVVTCDGPLERIR